MNASLLLQLLGMAGVEAAIARGDTDGVIRVVGGRFECSTTGGRVWLWVVAGKAARYTGVLRGPEEVASLLAALGSPGDRA